MHPGNVLTVAGTVSNCGSQAALISVTLTITRSGATLASYTKSFQLQPGQTQPEATSFQVPSAPGKVRGNCNEQQRRLRYRDSRRCLKSGLQLKYDVRHIIPQRESRYDLLQLVSPVREGHRTKTNGAGRRASAVANGKMQMNCY